MYNEMVQASRTVMADAALSTSTRRGHEINGAVALREAHEHCDRANMRLLDTGEELREG